MTDDHPPTRFEALFFEVFESLPRQGPGNRASTARALALCAELPEAPAILDLGCGVGGQTLHLAELTGGRITAVDRHAPAVDRLRATVIERGLEDRDRVRARVGDIADPVPPGECVDLLWSEGALYNVGIARALEIHADTVVTGGYVAFTDCVWRGGDRPAEVVAAFTDYPGMGEVGNVLTVVSGSAFTLVDHFPLPDEAWWDDFYAPLERRVAGLRRRYAGDVEARAILDEIGAEADLRRRHGASYGYEFVVARR